ncbi:MAG: copper oxidase [Anaerolineales bacterium]|nr:MAG: copper oxidase [Anaerolineales bacterium]
MAGGAAAYVASQAGFRHLARAAQSPQIPLAGSAIPQFVDPLPGLGDLGAIVADSGQIELQMTEFQTQVLPTGMPATWVWGYLQSGQTSRATYLGPVILATRDQPTEVKYVNNLGSAATTNVLAYRYSTDQTLHWADPLNGEANMWNHMAMPPAPGSEGAANYSGPIPAVVHLHGGEVPPTLDGGPDAWMTSDGIYKGHSFYSKDGATASNYHIYRYPNSQEGSSIWFHDHTLGATRLNVFCGLAGAYLILDPTNDPTNLPEGPIPLIIQDRMFDTNGQLFFPADSAGGFLWALNPEHPYWVPEFIGDVICVNGKAWPYLNVDPKRYTFLFLNGSNARTYEMALVDPVSGNPGPALWVIGTDGGYLDKPVQVGPAAGKNNKLVIMSGERYTVIIDFAGYQAGVVGPNGLAYSGTWLLKNSAKAPYPAGVAPKGGTTGQIMQFRVTGTPGTDTSFNPATPVVTLRGGFGQGPALVRLVNPAAGTVAAGVTVNKTRQLTLNEVMEMPQNAIDPVTGLLTAYPGGPLEILVNNTKWSGERITGVDANGMYMMEPIPGFTLDGTGKNYLSELPNEGETEVWEIINLTADAHPIHLHLVQFQLMNRQNFDKRKYSVAYAAAFPGGGYDPMTQAPYAPGVYIPGFGPPLPYGTGSVVGGNPDINAKDPKGKLLYLKGTPNLPLPQETGWKDTVMVLPGQVTRFVVRWAPTDLPASTPAADAYFPFDPDGGHGYVWHCHIVDHEDNEMMRPDAVTPNPNASRSYVQGVDY